MGPDNDEWGYEYVFLFFESEFILLLGKALSGREYTSSKDFVISKRLFLLTDTVTVALCGPRKRTAKIVITLHMSGEAVFGHG
jgi:hypothetical protein